MKPLGQRMAVQRQKKTGTTPRDPHAARYWDTELHSFLVGPFARLKGMVVGGRIDTKEFAKRAGVSRYTIYRWFQGPLSRNAVARIVKVADGRIEDVELSRFMV